MSSQKRFIRMPVVAALSAALVLVGCATPRSPEAEAARSALSSVKPSVYFDFDKYDIKKEYTGVVNSFGKYLKLDSDAKILIEGNADERGTTEYNLALGNKRAEAVRSSLGKMGVKAGQMEAISNGEEKPRAKGSNEAAWAENRRADLILK